MEVNEKLEENSNTTKQNIKKINAFQKYFYSIISIFRSNIRDYGMYIALIVIFIVFTLNNPRFLSPFNFTNLINQTAYVAVLAVGMTLVIVIREIDLSVGFLGAYLGASIVVAVENNGTNIVVAILLALAVTIFVGVVKGYFIAKIKVPSFVVTLAGMFIFKGLLMIVTEKRTISTSNDTFNKLGTGFLDIHLIESDILALVVGVVIVLLFVIFSIYKRNKNITLGIKESDLPIFISKLIVVSAIALYFSYTLSEFKGISFLLLVTAIIVVIYHFITTKTVLGRRIYAVGGNPEAAKLSGINVDLIVIIVFVSMGILTMIAGLMYVSNVQNASPNHGPFWELYAIAAAYIGGTSASGGVGKVVNAVVGALVIVSLKNGMALIAISSDIEPIILGGVLLLAVVFDIYTRNVRPIDIVGIHYAKQEFSVQYSTAKRELIEAKSKLSNAGEVSPETIVELEYDITNKKSAFNKIVDKIRTAKEEDYSFED